MPATLPVIVAPGTQAGFPLCALADDRQRCLHEQPAINDMLERGYAVAVTDYVGYHPEPETTYIIGKSMGAALLDVVVLLSD